MGHRPFALHHLRLLRGCLPQGFPQDGGKSRQPVCDPRPRVSLSGSRRSSHRLAQIKHRFFIREFREQTEELYPQITRIDADSETELKAPSRVDCSGLLGGSTNLADGLGDLLSVQKRILPCSIVLRERSVELPSTLPWEW